LTVEIKQFRGLRNVSSEERFRTGDLLTARDVDLDNTGKILSRRGYAQVNATALHSLYSNHAVALAVAGQNLKRVEADSSLTQLADLGSSNPVSYETVLNTVYYSNGVVSGKVEGSAHAQWGVTPPVGQPAAETLVVGSLRAGTYQYAMTFLRADGHESGTGVAGQVTLTAESGIRFTDMEVSTNPLIRDKILYLSGADGEVLFKVASVPNGQVSLDVSVNRGTTPLTTQFAGPPPAGAIVRYFNGNMFVVAGDTAYPSDPYNLELFRPEGNYLRFPGEVSLFECVDDGLYVATVDGTGDDSESLGATWYLQGTSAMAMKSTRVFDHGAVPGTSVRTDAGFLESPVEGEIEGMQARPAVLWISRFGVCAGFNGGGVRNYTEAKYSFPVAQRGAGMVRQERGYTQYVVSLQGIGAANNAYSRG